MNNGRRKALDSLRARIEMLKEQLDELRSPVETEAQGERESYDNLPDGLQCAEAGQRLDASATALENALDGLDAAIDALDETLEGLSEARE